MNAPPSRAPMTTKQQASDAGLELIELCTTITEDGRLLDTEIAALRAWMERRRDAELPSAPLVNETVTRVLTVGSVTDAVRAELQVAIERVLPPEARYTPKALQRAAEVVDRDLPIETYEFLVADTRHEPQSTVISRFAFDGDEVLLVRDPHNAHSRNAIIVRLPSGYDVGQVPEADARTLAQHLDQKLRYRANIKRILTGGHSPIPVVVAEVYSDDARVDDVRRTGEFRGPPLALGIRTPSRGTPKPTTNYVGIVLFSAVACLVILALAMLT